MAEPVIGQFGLPAIRALEAVGPQGGRRMAMLAADGHLARIGRAPEVLDVIAKYKRACEFVWKHKGALAVGTALTAFLLQPEAFINGTRDITKVVGENAVKPLAEVPGHAVQGIAAGTNWTVIILVAGGIGTLFLFACTKGRWATLYRRWQQRRRASSTAA